MGWWATKTRQASRYIVGRVSTSEQEALTSWLTPAQLALFHAMHRADQRHGLDVVARLRRDAYDDDGLLLAALLHDCSKGPGVRMLHRVAWSLGERYGDAVLAATSWIPGFKRAFLALRDHAEDSAALALAAGCSERTADLIRHQAAPEDEVFGVALRLADEAS